MPTGHYPFKHRGGLARVLWSWPGRPVFTGFSDDFVIGATQVSNKFSNILLADYQYSTPFARSRDESIIQYPPNGSLPVNWAESHPLWFNLPPGGTVELLYWQEAPTDPTEVLNLRVRRRLQEHRYMYYLRIRVYGGAVNNFGTFVRLQVDYVYNTRFDEVFPFYLTPDEDNLTTMTTPPTILRPGDETFIEHTYNHSVTPFSVPGNNQVSSNSSSPPPEVLDYYTDIYNQVVDTCESITSLNLTTRFAATPYSQDFPPQAPNPLVRQF